MRMVLNNRNKGLGGKKLKSLPREGWKTSAAFIGLGQWCQTRDPRAKYDSRDGHYVHNDPCKVWEHGWRGMGESKKNAER